MVWPSLTAADGIGELIGQPVVAIEFETAIPVDEGMLRSDLPLRVGEPLAQAALEASVDRLRAKETFDEVGAEVTKVPGGVLVYFRLRPSDLVIAVEFDGVDRVSEEDVRRRSRLRDGEAFDASRLEQARRRIEDFYASRGYAEARVEPGIDRVGPAAVRIVFRIEEGEPVRIERIALAVDGPIERDSLESALPFNAGDIWSTESLGEGERALRRSLRRRGFFESDIVTVESIKGKRAIPSYTVTLGVRTKLVVEGNQALRRRALLRVLDLNERPIITAGTWREMARRMRILYQENGFPFTAVEVTLHEGDPREVRFRIEEGPRIRLTAIRLQGNRRVSDRKLRAVMETRSKTRWPFATSGIFVADVFAEDLERIRERYRDEGYLSARIADLRFELDVDAAELRVTVVISEGKQSRLGRVELRGVETLPERIEVSESFERGPAYRAIDAEAERYRLLDRVRSLGRPDARVTIETTIRSDAEAGDEVDLDFVVTPGAEVRVGRVIVQRNFYTRERVVRRELELGPGDRLDPGELLDAQRRLAQLGLFRSASVTAEGETTVRDVQMRVAERPGGELQYGFGYNTSTGLRSFLQVAHRNLSGTGRSISLRGDVNLSARDLAPDEYVGDLGGRAPRLFGTRWDGRMNVVGQHRERDVDEFSIERFAISSGVEREILPKLQGSLLVELDDSRIFDVAPDAVLTGQDEGRLRTVSLNPAFIFDGRDDAFAPTEGVFDSVRVRYAAKAFGSEVGFVKLTGQHSHFVPLGAGLTWVYALRAGIAEVLEGASSVPLRERFFLGGRTTVRGFDENEIGPRGDAGNPVGGDLSLNVNTELRFPLFLGTEGAAFFDGGGLYLRDQAITFDEFRESAGPGLRYRTPIGSIGLDYGFKLDRRGGESIGEVHFSIGNLF